jgi:hypothetical protein
MKQLNYIAARNITIQCESGEVNYKKGSNVHIRHDDKENVWISYHEQDKNKKVHAFEINILDKDVFKHLLENVYVAEEEIDSKVSYEKINLDELLIEEQVQMKDLLKVMVESNYTKALYDSEKRKITIPVLRVKKEMSAKQKVFHMAGTTPFKRDASAKKLEAKGIKVKASTMESKGWILNTKSLFDKKLSTAAIRVSESLTSFFGNKAKVKLTKENKINVNLFNSDVAQLKECLNSLKVNYKIEGTKDQKVVTLFKPRSKFVVESYYKEEGSMDGNTIDDVVTSNVINADPFQDAAMNMKQEMEDKALSVNEEDVDQDKAAELMSSFDSKMEELNGMEDEEQKEGCMKEMEDIYNDYMDVMNGDEDSMEEPMEMDDMEMSSDCENCVDGLDPEGNPCDCQDQEVDMMAPMESKKKKSK